LNPEAIGVTFVLGDVAEVRLKPDPMPDAAATPDAAADLATANLTGALLAREAVRILGTVRPGGRLIVSGLLADEREDVVTAFRPAEILWESREDEWVAVTFGLPTF
jgi:ribosomal protein L11 methylase PrmA